MALIYVRHIVRLPDGVAHGYLSRFAASGGTSLVRVRHSDAARRAHVMLLDERPDPSGTPAWRVSWRGGVELPSGSGTLSLTEHAGETYLDLHGACASAKDVFAFRRACAFARAYLNALGDSMTAAIAA